ncbi:uncharacterized protein J4E79_010195 [Alternaria viburni]|uniref:uncharacterized protein n=1 Tax=Alternaria viburni TaxID=566460 RepID=UPI0020C563C0|nr:uncharacterized protein J4E79_010195 [Alternaria viburni]KAI4647337.1 hypothetical protein J4E79_010195 [Alternaria viburni]
MHDGRIYRLVSLCDGGFKKHKPLHNSLEGCYQRFWIWANYTGAGADDESNLDQRLEFSPDLQNELTYTGFPSVTAIHGALDELERIMMIKSRDKGCFEVAAVGWVKKLHPDIPETLAEQLGITIECRRLRLIRQKKYQQGFPLERYQYRQARLAQPEDQMVAALDDVTLTDAPILDPALPRDPASYQESVGSEATASSAARAYSYPKASKPSQGSEYCQRKWCVNKLRTEDLRYTRRWALPWNEDLQPYTCIDSRCDWPPIYFTSVDQWQKHMVEEHTTGWTEQIHRKVQHCSRHVDKEGHRERKEFQDLEALRDHLTDEHGLTEIDLRRALSRYRSPGTCLFCNFDAVAKAVPGDELETSQNANVGDAAIEAPESEELVRVKLWEHIGRHLKNLAFLSLKWFEENEVDVDGGDRKAKAAQREGSSDDDDREAALM